ncbi:hypothetical protein BRADI_1g63635v3 [Brachypodium distachyon]|uniref:Uncharacterized protein n=1 Tax=Brachypodium distachyon TaxID=15368 RepID=A0A2K2DT87_BRADI|nr:hypothetical protein BRADI_1g63635v3 [Brachypodium distachyon]
MCASNGRNGGEGRRNRAAPYGSAFLRGRVEEEDEGREEEAHGWASLVPWVLAQREEREKERKESNWPRRGNQNQADRTR